MKIAVEGCSHGELDQIYAAIEELKIRRKTEIDLLICCGDFQAVRNRQDLLCMAVSPKWRDMRDFYKYYSGEKTAPVLTIFIGGNHEASNHLSELAFGGWVAPNIYYMGYAGVVNVNGIKIAGLSGIFKKYDYLRGHHEFPPYDHSTMRSAYHIRNIDVYRLAQLHGKVDICISHDWPAGIALHGNTEQLYRQKRHLIADIESNRLGSPPALGLLKHLKPKHWLSAHLHVKFLAEFRHEQNDTGEAGVQVTKFMALDKCLPRRQYLEIIEIDDVPDHASGLHYDLEWLSILKVTDDLFNITPSVQSLPDHDIDTDVIEKHAAAILKSFDNDLKIPDNFSIGPPPYTPTNARVGPPSVRINTQTTTLCRKVGLTDPCVKYMQYHGQSIPQAGLGLSGVAGDCGTAGPAAEAPPSPGSAGTTVMSGIQRSALVLTTPSQQKDEKNHPASNPDEITLDSDESNDNEPCEAADAVVTDIGQVGGGETASTAPSSGDIDNGCSTESKRPTEETSAGPRKMKRRNQAIYTVEDE